MSALGEDGAFGRVMIGAAVAGLVAGALAFVPSPFGVLDLFQSVPPLEIKAPPPLKLQPVPVFEVYDLVTLRPLFNPDRRPDLLHRQGVGLGVATWGGAGHASKAKVVIHPDGSVEVELGSQDLGTGNRTCIAMVAAESLGLPLSAIKVKIGSNAYPASGPSGGSTTIGGVSTSTRKASLNALEKLFEKVAPSLGVPAEQLEAVDSRIQVKGNPNKAMSWKQAAQKMGPSPIEEMGENVPANAAREGLNTLGASGVQMAEVEVDTETGIVKMRKMVAVQDCGLVVNPKTAESQVFGACIMSICSALYEERVMDTVTGRVLNPDMEFYKLAGLPDIGEIVVHMDIQEVHDKRGIIGLGEPCAIGGTGAIANAVFNALGVRVPMVPVTSDRVLNAIGNRRYA